MASNTPGTGQCWYQTSDWQQTGRSQNLIARLLILTLLLSSSVGFATENGVSPRSRNVHIVVDHPLKLWSKCFELKIRSAVPEELRNWRVDYTAGTCYQELYWTQFIAADCCENGEYGTYIRFSIKYLMTYNQLVVDGDGWGTAFAY